MKIENNNQIQSWYPVARSCELKKGQIKPVKLFDQDWLLFRTESGEISFLSRYCCHMGADLCQGKVRNNAIECPIHAWQFNTAGHCVLIPNYTKPIPKRHIRQLPSEEKYGLIFVFWGEKPLFSIPIPPDISEPLVCSSVRRQDFNTFYQVLSLNSFDTQHYQHIHHRELVKRPDIYPVNPYALRIDFEVKILRHNWVDTVMSYLQKNNVSASVECWGANILTLTNPELNSSAMVAMQPIDQHHSSCYLIAMKTVQEQPSIKDKLSVAIAATLFKSYLHADIKPTRNMQLHRAGLLDNVDYGTNIYWDHVEKLPRFKDV